MIFFRHSQDICPLKNLGQILSVLMISSSVFYPVSVHQILNLAALFQWKSIDVIVKVYPLIEQMLHNF